MLLHAEELRYQSDTHAQKYDQACVKVLAAMQNTLTATMQPQ